jgi:cell division transport system ATP-binding protein
MDNPQRAVDRRQTMILFKDVSKVYGNGVAAINKLNMRIYKDEFVFLMGASGAGKSTLIKLLMKEEEPTTGTISVNSRDLSKIRKGSVQKYRRKIGVVFQDFRLLEHKTVFGNVAFAMEIMGKSRKEIQEKVGAALSLMGLSKKADEYPRNLSGGEQQRVALARAIVNSPKILIADEPTGNLDPANAEQIMYLLDLINSQGTTVIVATHAQEMARRMGRRILYLDHGVRNEELSVGDQANHVSDVMKDPGVNPVNVSASFNENAIEAYGAEEDVYGTLFTEDAIDDTERGSSDE